MSEYIVRLPTSGAADEFIRKMGVDDCRIYGYQITGEIVRCRDCEYFDTRKCKSQWPFCLDAFCWWGEPKEDVE